MTNNTTNPSKIMTVLRVTSGNFLEMYDFFLFGFYATYIAKAFFPGGSEYASLLKAFATFGAGFFMRPLGAIILGSYIDRVGRRQGLIVTLAIMACGTILIAFVPDYATIGLMAPILVLIGRLLQGFSAGVELGGVSIYLSEMATPGRKGFYVSWQSASQQVAIIFSALLGYWINAKMNADSVHAWGWRIPFFVGCLIIPLVFILRRSLQETDEFKALPHRPAFNEVIKSIQKNWQVILTGMLMVVMTTVYFYTITVYTPTFGSVVLKLSAADSLIVALCVGILNFTLLPIMGALSDRIGRWPLLTTCTLLALFTSYPVLAWLVATPTFQNMMIAELWFAFLYASYNGAAVVALTEVMPAYVRASGFSLAYSLATALFGGLTPWVSTKLIEYTGNKATPGWWMTFAAACGLTATFLFYRGLVKAR